MSENKIDFSIKKEIKSKDISCLGLSFDSDDERREYFREELRKKLPELKKIEGYPIGEDEDIINLSDPPYYTACPNPWLNDFINEWEKDKENNSGRKNDFKVNEPYASDISEGKNNPIYNAHSYHTKVPHPAIMRYILHYTQPGGIVFDGFAGTGMTGVAAQMCYKPGPEIKAKIEQEWKDAKLGIPNWGTRKSIIGDLSPVASFIAYNYNTPVNVNDFTDKVKGILTEVENEYGWMYKTIHTQGKLNKSIVEEYTSKLKKCKTNEEISILVNSNKSILGKINYTAWSDVFLCSECGNEIVFWDTAVDQENIEVQDEFKCTSCNALHSKRSIDKVWITTYDKFLGKTIKCAKIVPVLINYSVGTKRFEKEPDAFDLELIKLINEIDIPFWFPVDALPMGYNTQQPIKSHGITHVHHFYTKKSLTILARFKEMMEKKISFFFTPLLINTSKMGRYGKRTGNVSGTLYVPSLIKELNVIEYALRKFSGPKGFEKPIELLSALSLNDCNIFTQSVTEMSLLKNNICDYIFTDPPFGSNIMYSELNFIWESWIKVKTNNKDEAIENSVQNKGFLEYQNLMLQCFKEYYRILKPGKWMTVEFSNTSAAVWNGIQTSIQRAGFVIANVAALDKQQGSFKAVTTTTAVKQDLIISCYKPSEEFESKIEIEKYDVNVWEFVREHLQHLPIEIRNTHKITAVVERSPKILYDRLVTFYLMRGLSIPIDAGDFQIGLKQRFEERDNMFFTTEQAAKYDEIYFGQKSEQYALVFDSIYSESEAILWLKERLKNNPQTYQDLMPDFRKANRINRKGEFIAELLTILEENFIKETDGKWRVPDLNEAKDREILKNKSLLKEFDRYIEEINNWNVKRIKEVRVEALRAGFKMCWEKKDFSTIVKISEKIPQNILLEDEQLLMYYDIAKDKL